jgi:hypothetical protein
MLQTSSNDIKNCDNGFDLELGLLVQFIDLHPLLYNRGFLPIFEINSAP